MSKIIEVSHLGKLYRLGANKERYLSLRDSLSGVFKSNKKNTNTFWALEDVSFDVNAGDSIGIIGKNGAGKSTLLKILSRITPPTSGKIEVYGRIASLLEVGTGFHPELSGRENIYLNGSILGMKRIEIKAKFDEIVAFSGVEKFIDTSVKHYSSGMYVRLAFAVAAHLEPEVLIVDEVLAVGDAEFQKKCLGKMEQVSKEQGRTVLFVSHNMGAIQNLCTKAIVLNKGKLIANTDVNSGIKIYNENTNSELSINRIYNKEVLNHSLPIEILNVCLESPINSPEYYDIAEDIYVNIKYVIRKELKGAIIKIVIASYIGDIFWSFDTDENPELLDNRKIGIYTSRVKIPANLLKPGVYSLNFGSGVANSDAIEDVEDKILFETIILSKSDAFLSYSSRRKGLIAQSLKWQTEHLDII